MVLKTSNHYHHFFAFLVFLDYAVICSYVYTRADCFSCHTLLFMLIHCNLVIDIAYVQMTLLCGLDLLLIPVIIVGAAIAVIITLIVAAVLIYIILEMLSILIVLGYLAAIPIVFFLACLVVPFILAGGIPILLPILAIVAPRLTFIDYIYECLCKCLSCLSFLNNKGCCGDKEKESQNININTAPSFRRRNR